MAQKKEIDYNLEFKQLCWNCKRCTNPDGAQCPWAKDGTPVEGWTATPGKKYYNRLPGGEIGVTSQSYKIVDCPLFIKDKPFTTCAEAVAFVAKAFNLHESTIRFRKITYFKRYERETGNKLPYWLYEEALGHPDDKKLNEKLGEIEEL